MITSDTVLLVIAGIGAITLLGGFACWVRNEFGYAWEQRQEEKEEWAAKVNEARNMIHAYALAIESGDESLTTLQAFCVEIQVHRALMLYG